VSGIAHLAGDYVAQSDWMATGKLTRALPAAAHALTYTACFLPVTRNPRALAVIGGTHYVIDRYRLARYLVWAKEQLAPRDARPPWPPTATGYSEEKPTWLAVPLLIVADNTVHLLINRWALRRWSS
jgi:hypothetical protein